MYIDDSRAHLLFVSSVCVPHILSLTQDLGGTQRNVTPLLLKKRQ